MAHRTESEVLIIGSGFGGSIAAKRLTDAGLDVVLLERGPWRDTTPTRSMGIRARSPLPQGWRLLTHGFRSIRMPGFRKAGLTLNTRGFFEAFFANGIWLFCTSNVGGGSHAYAGLHDRPGKHRFWDGHHPDLSHDAMDPYYDQIIAQFGSRPVCAEDRVPNHMTLNGGNHPLDASAQRDPAVGLLLPLIPGNPRKVADALGVERWECAMDDNSFLGSASGAKTTLDFAFLWPAIKNGLDLRELSEVRTIHALPDAGDGPRYEVRYRDHKRRRNAVHRARHVIVAAGGINTVRLLMHSRDVAKGLNGMPRLGHGIGGNGDFFGFWQEDSAEDLTKGLPVGGGFKARGSKHDDAYIVRAGLQGLDHYPLPKRLKRWLRGQSIIIGLGKDEANGESRMRGRKYLLSYDRDRNPGYDAMDDWMAEVEAATATKVYKFRTPISVHPMGGAGIGADADHGVIDANGEVYGHPGLYVADSAAFPEAPGGPPSMTISVWSANVADRLIDRLGRGARPGPHAATALGAELTCPKIGVAVG